MPLRIRKIFKIAPGVKVNLSKGGISTSFGTRGASLNLGKKGPRATVGLPGTGVSYTAGAPKLQKPKRRGCGTTAILLVVIVAAIMVTW